MGWYGRRAKQAGSATPLRNKGSDMRARLPKSIGRKHPTCHRRLLIWLACFTYVLLAAVMSGCGSEPAVDSSDPLVSEKGQIAFTRMTQYERADLEADIYTINVDGTGERRLTDTPGLDGFPSWSPDGQRIAFATDRAGGNWELYVMDSDGTHQRRLTNTPKDEAGTTWSPSGEEIAFVFDANGDNPSIWVMDADGSNRKRLTSGNWPSWSADGERIVYTSGEWNDQQLSVMNADGSEQHTLGIRGAGQPAWSPNGEQIAYVNDIGRDKESWDNEEIFVMSPDGSGRTRLTDIPGNDHWPPTWSPDGARIAFTSDGTKETGRIFVMNSDGSGLTKLTDGSAYDGFPAWRP